MKVTKHSPLAQYGLAVLAVAVAVLIRWLLHPLVGDRYIFVTFFPAVMVAAYFGGLKPGLLAALLSALAGDYFYLPTANLLIPAGPTQWVGLIVAVFNMMVVSVLTEVLHRSRRKAADSTRRIAEQEHRYRTMVETAAEGIWIVDTDERTTFVNSRLIEMFGYSADEMIGLTPYDFIFEEDQEAAHERLRQRRTGDNRPRDFRYRRKDGSAFWATVTTSVLRGAQGEFVGLLALLTDITARVKADEALRAALAESQDLYNNAPCGYHSLDANGVYVSINDTELAWLGYTREEVIGKLRFADLLLAEQRVHFRKNFDRFKREGQIREIEFTLRRKNGALLPILLTSFAIYDAAGEYRMSRTTIFDITERKQFEAERDALLQREQEARQLAENANRMKDEFLATLSHEMRTPLNAILGWSQMLRQKQLDDGTAGRAIEVIYRNARAQAQIVEDLLDVSRIIAGKLMLKIQPVQLDKVVDAALDAVRPMAETKQVAISRRVEAQAAVIGDAVRLQQIVLNLLTNAVKFTPRGGHVEMLIEADQRVARIVVKDDGQGIHADFLPLIFERFRQADSSYTRKYTGLGLGLAIVRHLVQLHGGAVEVYSAGEGCGSTFTITLPLALAHTRSDAATAQAAGADGAAAVTTPPLVGVKVLVVDDDEDTREVLRAILSLMGAEVSLADGAAEAIGMVRRWRPDVLLSDIGMPDEDGYALIRAVRHLAADEGGNVRAVALTGYASDEEGERARQAGFQAHQAKPVDAQRLIETVARLAGVGDRVRGA